MPRILQLSPHVANLIAAGEVVERPASVVKELLENAVDAGASQVTVEIRDGGMTFIRITDNGCGMSPEDARTAFLRHATSKLRSAEDLAAIATMGFRGEALAAIASVSRIDLLTKTPGSISGTSLSLEAGSITEDSEAGCPDGTTIIVRDLFFNTPARMKFMKSDTVEGGKVSAAVQLQALAHPEVSFRFIRDGKEVLSTPGTGQLEAAVYCVYGRECGKMVKVESRWENYSLTGYISKPTDSRPSRSLQTFFVNDRPVKSRILIAALEEAYRNQIMVGKFPACVLHLHLPSNAVDVNVHPAKTEVKFLNEKAVFDCVHYGVLGALNKTPDRPQVQFKPVPAPAPIKPAAPQTAKAPKQENFFRTMTAEEYRTFSAAVKEAPKPSPLAAAATAAAVERSVQKSVKEQVILPKITPAPLPKLPEIKKPEPVAVPAAVQEKEPQQAVIETMPQEIPWRYVGELYNSYIIVEQGEDAYLIDKHAAHERILFEKLKANQEAISAQSLLTPVPCRLSPEECSILLANKPLLEELGFEVEEFGENTLLLRQIPMDLGVEQAAETLEQMAADLLNGRREKKDSVRDEILHTVACKAAIKAGWKSSEAELKVLIEQVMSRDDLKHCPHGRPICITLSKKQLEKQFKRA
ncbi:MAG: DNA mismatch repair endonuclease MutL [Oscillospiraceae bacterium]|nr:DNA mismatch repair endonuclease MutL [Oscillospiraceae bacterium]